MSSDQHIDLEKEKEELIDYVKSMPLYDNIGASNFVSGTGEYDALVNLIQNMDDTLFVKTMEEIKNGNLTLGDFQRLLISTDYGETLENSIENQRNLYNEYELLMNEYTSLGLINDGDKLDNLATFKKYTTSSGSLSVINIEKKQRIYELLSKDTGDPYIDYYRNLMFMELVEDPVESGSSLTPDEIADKFLQSVEDYIVPVDFRYIQLTDRDKKFAEQNGLTTDQMKKLKSMMAFHTTTAGGNS